MIPLEQNVLISDRYFVVGPTPWTIKKKGRKESTKFLKVGGLYVRFDLANKEQEIIVYFDSWDKFAAAVEQLCIAEPNKFRFVIKYPHVLEMSEIQDKTSAGSYTLF